MTSQEMIIIQDWLNQFWIAIYFCMFTSSLLRNFPRILEFNYKFYVIRVTVAQYLSVNNI